MNKKLSFLPLLGFLLGVLLLSACGTSTADNRTLEVEQQDVATETPLPDTQVPEVEIGSSVTEELEGGTEYEIITLLPKDAIQSIDDPEFYSVAEADEEYFPGEFVIGVEFDGQARAYSVPLLSRREIVNDTVNGKPISVTW